MKKNVNVIDYAKISEKIKREVASEKTSAVKKVIVHKFTSVKMFAEFVKRGGNEKSAWLLVMHSCFYTYTNL